MPRFKFEADAVVEAEDIDRALLKVAERLVELAWVAISAQDPTFETGALRVSPEGES